MLSLFCIQTRQPDITFKSRSKTFWSVYKREAKGVPLRDTIIKSISDESNLLGEGLSKKGYSLVGIKDYIVRIYKKGFRLEDLDKKFTKPPKNYLSSIEGIVVSIPDKIDIVKRKSGCSVGVENYADRIQMLDFPPLRNVSVSREESLKALNIYEQLKNFPIKSYKQAYIQIKKFCKRPDYQFDIISPNNILVDTKDKKINLIDPVSPQVNRPVHGDNVDFSKFHGCDSLYPILCDFLMHKEHLKNLTPEERTRWNRAINLIIAKCLYAGQEVGFGRNIEQLKELYNRITKFWKTEELNKRYNNFLEMYSAAINPVKTAEIALNYQNKETDRVKAINELCLPKFKLVKPVLEKIIEAPHQPKVEFPEILNAALDKIAGFGNSVKSITPTLEKLFDKEIFCTTKRRLYDIFIETEPKNKKFLDEIEKSAFNPFEKTLYREEFENLYKKSLNFSKTEDKFRIRNIIEGALKGEKFPQELVDKLWISRTCTNTSKVQKISVNNMLKAYNMIELSKDSKPKTSDLIELHKIVLDSVPVEGHLAGRLRTPDTDEIVRQIFHIKGDVRKTVNDYSASKDVVRDLRRLDEYINKNYDNIEAFELAANIFEEVIRIHPFINGNGRAARLFTEQVLLSKGYRLRKWPEETLYRKIYSKKELAEFLRKNSVKI